MFKEEIKRWGVTHSIKHNALKDLFKILNNRLSSNILFKDPRTLLGTKRNLVLHPVGKGYYWHQGFTFCIRSIFQEINESKSISINTGIDGLPTYKSSKDEFWRILFNIYKMPEIPAMIIGIYSGKSKPNDLNAYRTPFVNEMKEVLNDGILINEHKITVTIRCFICDSPARSFIKGKNQTN